MCVRARVHTNTHTNKCFKRAEKQATQGFAVHLNKISIFALLIEFRFKVKNNIYSRQRFTECKLSLRN